MASKGWENIVFGGFLGKTPGGRVSGLVRGARGSLAAGVGRFFGWLKKLKRPTALGFA